jgi:hypothetical protein
MAAMHMIDVGDNDDPVMVEVTEAGFDPRDRFDDLGVLRVTPEEWALIKAVAEPCDCER